LAPYILRRLGLSIVSLFGAVLVTFFVTHLLPGNPVLVHAGFKIPSTIKFLEQQMGLDQPLPVQFQRYVAGLAHGDMGYSFYTGNPVAVDLSQRLPASLELAAFGTLLALLIGLPLGILSAVRRDSVWDHLTRIIGVGGVSMPVFWVGLVLVFVFYYSLHLAPAPLGRLETFAQPPSTRTGLLTVDSLLAADLATFQDALGHLVLPGVTLALVVMVPIMRITRASMLEALGQPYIRTARAVGLPYRWVVLDALRNSLINVLTIGGLVLGYLIGGAVLVEKVFAWPGMGQYALNALLENDYSAVQGFILTITTLYILLNLLIDVLYAVIDPRIHRGLTPG
jgi:ABC-type dipeptide/oligopeptide/nickel transport system permease component